MRQWPWLAVTVALKSSNGGMEAVSGVTVDAEYVEAKSCKMERAKFLL